MTLVQHEMSMTKTVGSDLQLIQRNLYKCCCSESGNATSRNRSWLSPKGIYDRFLILNILLYLYSIPDIDAHLGYCLLILQFHFFLSVC